MLSGSKYIKEVSFRSLFNWSVQYLSETKISFNSSYPMVKIGSFLKRNKTSVTIEDGVTYKRVTIRVRNGGVVQRDTEIGNNIGTKKQYRVSEGQFILSKIDARNGAMGLIPAELESAIVTQDFLPYDIDTSKVNPQYLVLVSTTAEFVAFCQTCSSGTTNRQRVDESKFLDIKIPLPTIEEQNELVAEYNNKITLAENQLAQATSKEAEIKKYLSEVLGLKHSEQKSNDSLMKVVSYKDITDRWDILSKPQSLLSSYKINRLGNVIKSISTGTTPPTSVKEYFDGEIKFFTPADVTDDMYLVNSSRTITKYAVDNKKARLFQKGDILFVGIGSTVGKVGIVNDKFVSSNQQITGFSLDINIVTPEYVFIYLNYNKNISTAEQSKTTLPIVNQDKISNIPIPVPPLEVQNEIAIHIQALKEQIKQLRTTAEANRQAALTNFEQKIF